MNSILQLKYHPEPPPLLGREGLTLSIAGLGDVGGMLATGLRLLAGSTLKRICLFDPDPARAARYEQELNQVALPGPMVLAIGQDELMDADVFVFAASRSIPDPAAGDVRMAQLGSNRELLKTYAQSAARQGFGGLFAVLSDPVDLLCRAALLDSNGLSPFQVRGFGLGVMHARARYYAQKLGLDPGPVVAFGPHGAGLVVANAAGSGYEHELSLELTRLTVGANLELRKTGFKPYIAPALSSGCVQLLAALRGEWHLAAAPFDGGKVYFGCKSRFSEAAELFDVPLHPMLFERLCQAYAALEAARL